MGYYSGETAETFTGGVLGEYMHQRRVQVDIAAVEYMHQRRIQSKQKFMRVIRESAYAVDQFTEQQRNAVIALSINEGVASFMSSKRKEFTKMILEKTGIKLGASTRFHKRVMQRLNDR